MATGIDLDTPIELLTPAEMGEADALAIAGGITGLRLMDRAGAAVAAACLAMLGTRRRVAVLCGPGNNGGDGFVAARLLQAAGCTVAVGLLGERDVLRGDAASAARSWAGPVMAAAEVDLTAVDLIVDALFGAGLSRPLDGLARALVERMDAAAAPIVAVDVPSGVDGRTGAIRGAAPIAAVTVTFFRAKPGHHLFPGAARCGRLELHDIGLPASVLDTIRPQAMRNGPAGWLRGHFPWPDADGHKYSRGHTVVLSGSAAHTGAARMSARAALRVGSGLVTLATPEDALAINAAQLTAVMVRVSDGPQGLAAILADGRKNAVVLGPALGIGSGTRDLVDCALSTPVEDGATPPRACVLDADALTSFEADAAALRALIDKARGPVVITPHDGEFARLFKGRHEVTEAGSKLDRARAAAAALGCVVLLKGPDTVVATPEGWASIADGGSPWLATAGSGDVLSGLVAGLLAQRMPVFEAASAAVWIHAECARRFGPGLIAEDIPEAVPAVLRDLHAASVSAPPA